MTGASAGCSSADIVRAVAAELRSTAAASPLEGLPHDARGVPVVAPWADPLNLQDLNRLRQIATIAARHGFADLLERAGVLRLLGRREKVEVSPEAQRASTARRFRHDAGGPGPHVHQAGAGALHPRGSAARPSSSTSCATLQDQVAPIPLEARARADPRRRWASDAGGALRAASTASRWRRRRIAQVHRAVTLGGRRGGGEGAAAGHRRAQIDSDLGVLRSLARLLEAVVEETGIYTPTGIVDEFDRAIHEELDFVHEAANIRAFLENHRDRAVHPHSARARRALSSRTVLTLEFIRRGEDQPRRSCRRSDRTELARTHPGRQLPPALRGRPVPRRPAPGQLPPPPEGDRLALLDFGVVGRLTRADAARRW